MHFPASQQRQRFTTLAALAALLGVTVPTARRWIRLGYLRAFQVGSRHYSDARPRRTMRAQWRIYEADVLRLIGKVATIPGKSPRIFGATFWRK